jgi:putative transposase
VLDRLLAGAGPRTALEREGRRDDPKKAPAERGLDAERDRRLRRRTGRSAKRLRREDGDHRHRPDRAGGAARSRAGFDPRLIAGCRRRFPGFDDAILPMDARGASTREMVGPPRELHAIDVAPDPIGAGGDAVPDEVAARPARPPETVRPPVVFDAPRVKIGDDGPVRGKAGRIAPGMRADGGKELPGPWLERNEGAEFRPRVINGLENRGAEDGPIALLDGLKGFPEAITAVFPRAMA